MIYNISTYDPWFYFWVITWPTTVVVAQVRCLIVFTTGINQCSKIAFGKFFYFIFGSAVEKVPNLKSPVVCFKLYKESVMEHKLQKNVPNNLAFPSDL